MATERRTWRCRVCGHEHTPRCPTCRVVVTAREASAGRCNTCGNPITAAVYTCPQCHTERALQPPQPQRRPGERPPLTRKLLGLMVARFIVGTLQTIGLFLFLGTTCIALTGDSAQGDPAASLVPFQLVGFVLFLALVPVQILLIRRLKEASGGAIAPGERRPRQRQDDRRR